MATAVITGANRGIGLELCRLLRERGDDVIGVCRSSSPELVDLGARVEAGVDLGSGDDIGALASRLDGTEIDLLVNNAGILEPVSLERLDVESIRRQFEVNALGPLRLTAALLPRLRRGARLALVTSRMGSLADNTSGGSYGYRMAKAALNMVGVSLAQDLRERGIAVCILHPGYVRTGMTGGHGNIDPPEAAAGLLARIDELTLETSGGFWHAGGERLPW